MWEKTSRTVGHRGRCWQRSQLTWTSLFPPSCPSPHTPWHYTHTLPLLLGGIWTAQVCVLDHAWLQACTEYRFSSASVGACKESPRLPSCCPQEGGNHPTHGTGTGGNLNGSFVSRNWQQQDIIITPNLGSLLVLAPSIPAVTPTLNSPFAKLLSLPGLRIYRSQREQISALILPCSYF